MSRIVLCILVAAGLCIPAACGGRGTVDGYEIEGPVGAGGATVSGTGAGGGGAVTVNASSNGSTAINSAVVSSSSGGGECDVGDDCSGCIDCSIEGPCNAAYNNCFSDDQCIAFNDCINNCVEPECFDDCVAAYPQGEQLYTAAVVCVFCDACPVSCEDQVAPGSCR